jgi:TolB protein
MTRLLLASGCVLALTFLSVPAFAQDTLIRSDGAHELKISHFGSLQNASWSPDGKQIVFTVFRRGYNHGPSDLAVFDVSKQTSHVLLSNGFDNISQPGSTWSRTKGIIFSSTSPDIDQIFSIDPKGENITQLTGASDKARYEPSWSPDGRFFVYEEHNSGRERDGAIMLAKVDDDGAVEPLTSTAEDCRQPNWSPVSDEVVYQCKKRDHWELWIINTRTRSRRAAITGEGEATDATFSPDGRWLLYSLETSDSKGANLFVQPIFGGDPIQITRANRYDGAPSWSPDGSQIVFESYPQAPWLSERLSNWISERLPSLGHLLLPKSHLWLITVPKELGMIGKLDSDGSVARKQLIEK